MTLWLVNLIQGVHTSRIFENKPFYIGLIVTCMHFLKK